MADTKQATAERVCEECGERIVYLRDFGWMHCDTHGTPDHYATPRTQPSQTELRIPDDLKELYDRKNGYGIAQYKGGDWPEGWSHNQLAQLIERIARLEGAIRWANGEIDEFPERKPGEGAYWCRKELMRRARLEGAGR